MTVSIGVLASSFGPQEPQHQCGLQGSDDRIPAFVLAAVGRTTSVSRLLEGVAREHAVADGSPFVQGYSGQAVSHRIADVIEVRRTAPDHCPETSDRVMSFCQLGGDDWELDCARHTHDRRLRRPARRGRGGGPGGELVGDLRVPARSDDRDAQPVSVYDLPIWPALPAHCACDASAALSW